MFNLSGQGVQFRAEYSDADKVRRELAKQDLKRSDKGVVNTTSDDETRSLIIMDDNTFGISCVSATVLASRANEIIDVPDKKNSQDEN